MLLAYSLVGKGFHYSTVRAVFMLPEGSMEESVGEEEVKGLEVLTLEGGGGIRQRSGTGEGGIGTPDRRNSTGRNMEA